MTLFFQAIFTWAAPLMDGVEALVIAMGSTIASVMPEGVVADFVNDAIFAGSVRSLCLCLSSSS